MSELTEGLKDVVSGAEFAKRQIPRIEAARDIAADTLDYNEEVWKQVVENPENYTDKLITVLANNVKIAADNWSNLQRELRELEWNARDVEYNARYYVQNFEGELEPEQ